MAAAGFFITMANCLVQFVYKSSHTTISPYIFLFYRSLVIFGLNSVFMIAGRVHPLQDTRNLFLLVLMGIAGTGQILFVFLALERMPVGDATVIQFTAPVFTMSFSFFLLGISCSLFDTICGCVSFIGVVIMTKPGIFLGGINKKLDYPSNLTPDEDAKKADETDYLIGVGFALISSVFVSIFYVLNKMLGKKLDLTITIFYPSLLGILIAPIVNICLGESMHVPWSWASVAVILLVGLLSFVHLLLVAEALQLEDAGPAALVRNADIVYAFVIQFFFLGVKPKWTTLLGAAIIVTTTSMVGFRRIFQTRSEVNDN